MFRKSLLALLVAISFIAIGCQEIQEGGGSYQESYDYNACDAGFTYQEGICLKSNQIKDNTVVITTGEADNILTYVDRDKLVFAETDRTLKFKVGDIIAFQETDKFENGYVAEITEVALSNGEVSVFTTPVNPFKAFKDAQIDIKKIITANPNSELFKNPTQEDLDKYAYDVEHHILDFDKNATKSIPFSKSWDSDKLKLSGSIDFSNLLEIKIDIREVDDWGPNSYYLDEFMFKNTFGLKVNAKLEATFLDITPNLKKIRGGALFIRQKFMIAKFPVVVAGIKLTIRFDLSASVKPSAHLQGTATLEGTSDNTVTAGVWYKRNKPYNWRSNTEIIKGFTSTNTLSDEVKLEGTAAATLTLKPAITIFAYFESLLAVRGGVDIDFTPLKLGATLSSSVDIDQDGNTNSSVKACFRADAELALTPFVSVDAVGIDPQVFKSDSPWLKKGWSWLDFMTAGGYLGSCGTCHSGLTCVSGRCKARSFWSVVGQGDDGEVCKEMGCDNDADCRSTYKTADATCVSRKCVYGENGSKINYQMISIPEGSYQRGCVTGDGDCLSSEKPVKTVQLKAFKIGKYEVKNSEYRACVNAGVCRAPVNSTYLTKHNQPVSGVKWTDAVKFCAWAGGLRLPTEAEWERAAKGNGSNKYVWSGNDEDPTCEKTMMEGLHKYLDSSGEPTDEPNNDANGNPQNELNPKYGNGCGTSEPADVGTHPSDKSPYGVYDMAGNVREWTKDFYNGSYYSLSSSTDNPKGYPTLTNNLISVRGGGYMTNRLSTFRNSNRGTATYFSTDPEIGFRCAVYK